MKKIPLETLEILVIIGAIIFFALIVMDIVFICKLTKKKKALLKAETNVSEQYDDFYKARERFYAVSALYLLLGVTALMLLSIDEGMSVSELFDAFWLSVLKMLLCVGPRSSIAYGFEKLDKQQQKRIDALIAAEQKAKSIETEDAAQKEETHL